MSKTTHWRIYFACAIGDEGKPYVEVSGEQGEELQRQLPQVRMDNGTLAIATGRRVDIRESRALFVNPAQIVAMEPRED